MTSPVGVKGKSDCHTGRAVIEPGCYWGQDSGLEADGSRRFAGPVCVVGLDPSLLFKVFGISALRELRFADWVLRRNESGFTVRTGQRSRAGGRVLDTQ